MCCRLRACCYVISLRSGTLIIAGIDIVVVKIVLILAIIELVTKESLKSEKWHYALAVIFIIVLGIVLLFGILLLIGAIMNRVNLVKPWICITCSCLIAISAFCGYLIYKIASSKNVEDFKIFLLCFLICVSGAAVYSLCIVHSYLEERGAAHSKATCPF